MSRRAGAIWILLLFGFLLLVFGCGRSSPSSPAGSGTSPPGASRDAGGELVYVQIDVGQGDSQLIISPDGRGMLVDGGPPGRQEAILAALAAHRVETLDYAVASHPHNDHIGSLDDIVRRVPVKQFLDSGFNYGSDPQRRLLTAIKEMRVPFQLARAGQSFLLGDSVTVSVLAPREPLLMQTSSDANNNSVVLKVTYQNVRILLTGDMEEPQRRRLFEENADLEAEVYKVAHHGSYNGTDAALLERVKPQVALISCAPGNDYGHPHRETLQALASAGAAIYRTDLQGTITLTSDGQTWRVQPEREAQFAVTTPGRRLTGGGGTEDRPGAGVKAPGNRRGGPETRGPAPPDGAVPAGTFVGNRRTKVYHRVDEGSQLPAPRNRVYFETEEDARRAGYRSVGE